MSHHQTAVVTIIAALAIDAVCGWLYSMAMHLPLWHGLYNALANAVTLGGDTAPVGWGYLINTVECFTVVPLFAAALSFFTSGLASVHVRKAVEDINNHVTATVGS